MTQSELEYSLSTAVVVPVTSIPAKQTALDVAKALADGGIHVIEITLRTDAALSAIEAVANGVARGEVQTAVGAGSVTTVEQIASIRESGATFAVTPGFSEQVSNAMIEAEIPHIPGIATVGEAMRGMALGLQCFKVFPAGILGGPAYLKAISAPLPGIRFVPTGGVNEGNLKEYLALDSVLACGGSWITPSKLMKSGDYAKITELARSARAVTST